MIEQALKPQAFKLKGRLYTLTVLQLIDSDLIALNVQLEELSKIAPRMFMQTPVVLDCSCLEDSIPLKQICQLLKSYQLIPVALQGAKAGLIRLAEKLSMAVLKSSSTLDKDISPPSRNSESSDQEEINLTKFINTPVRSGQQVVSKGGDLIIAASVSAGAELLADGNIHVYGPLRGRALAGISGDKNARIFCQSLEAELVAIAGFYRLSDAIEGPLGPCQIYLQDDRITIDLLC